MNNLYILQEVRKERIRQEQISAEKREHGIEWRSCADLEMEGGDDRRVVVLLEEVGEVAKAVLEHDLDNYREEAIQVAAVAVAIVESIDARQGRSE